MGEKVVEPTTSAKADKESAEPLSVPDPVDVEEKYIKVNLEDAGIASWRSEPLWGGVEA